MPDQNEIQAELVDDVQPFTMLQNAFIDDARVSPAAFRLFVTLKSYTSGRSANKTAFPSYETIREKSGLGSYATIVRAIRELETLGWIVRVKRYGRSTLYTLRASPTVSVGLQKVKDQSYRNCNISPTVSVGEQEVPKQEVLQQEVAANRRAADAAVAKAGIANAPSQKVLKSKAKKLAAPDPYSLGDLEKVEAIQAHRRICGYQPMTIEQAQHIVSRVNGTATTTWPADLLVWTQSTRRSDNQPYRLDAIEKQVQFHLDLEVRRRNKASASGTSSVTAAQWAALEEEVNRTL